MAETKQRKMLERTKIVCEEKASFSCEQGKKNMRTIQILHTRVVRGAFLGQELPWQIATTRSEFTQLPIDSIHRNTANASHTMDARIVENGNRYNAAN